MKNSQWRTEDESSLRDGRWTEKKEEKVNVKSQEGRIARRIVKC